MCASRACPDVPDDVAVDGFQSKVVRRYEPASAGTQALFARLYLEGLAPGDSEPVFRELVGGDHGAVGHGGSAAQGALG
jgi:hypothetical protein